MIFEFIWNSKKAKIRRSLLKREISKGGLNIHDFESMVKTSRLKWIKQIFKGTNYPWLFSLKSIYSINLYNHLNTLLHANCDISNLGLDTNKIPKFYKEVLTVWSLVGNTYPSDKKHLIWYNKNIFSEQLLLCFTNNFWRRVCQ